MSASLKGGARLMVGFEGSEPDSEFLDLLLETGARAVILFARNIRDASQLAELTEQLRALVPEPLLIAIDQEGGAVVRVNRGMTVFPGNMALGAADDPELALLQGRVSGAELAARGIDLNLAPVVDLQTDADNPGIGIRSFGDRIEHALPLAAGLIEGHREAGVSCCLKHFPGKGAAMVDAHLDLPVLELSLEEFRHPHLSIFEELVRSPARPAVMTTHMIVRGLDGDLPATLSRRVAHDLLRDDLGFRGALLTDCMEMGAIEKNFGVARAARDAAVAGHDLVIVSHRPDRQRQAAAELDRALRDGILDLREHEEALQRIASLRAAPARSARDLDIDGRDPALRIARRAVVAFGAPLVPLKVGRDTRLDVLLPQPEALVQVEERLDEPVAETLRASLEGASLAPRVSTFDPRLGLPALEEDGDRVLFCTWDASGNSAVREALEQAVSKWGARLIVLHLRNPFDQRFVPDHIPSLTAFGFRACQLEALTEALCGRLLPEGRMPAALTSSRFRS